MILKISLVLASSKVGSSFSQFFSSSCSQPPFASSHSSPSCPSCPSSLQPSLVSSPPTPSLPVPHTSLPSTHQLRRATNTPAWSSLLSSVSFSADFTASDGISSTLPNSSSTSGVQLH